MDDNVVMKMLSSDEFDPPYKALTELRKQKKVSKKVLLHILSLEDKLIVGDFLENFLYFSNEQLGIIEQYIFQHLNDKDPLFLSSLIECANINTILSFYDNFLNIICTRRNDIVILAALDYIFDNMQFFKIKKIVRVFRRVINNKSYYQNCQTVAAFYLFRLTMHMEYYSFLKNLVLEGGELNYIVLKNMLLKAEYNNKKYFAYFDDLMIIVRERENYIVKK